MNGGRIDYAPLPEVGNNRCNVIHGRSRIRRVIYFASGFRRAKYKQNATARQAPVTSASQSVTLPVRVGTKI